MTISSRITSDLRRSLQPFHVQVSFECIEKVIAGSELEKQIVTGKSSLSIEDQENFKNLFAQQAGYSEWPTTFSSQQEFLKDASKIKGVYIQY